MTKLTIAGREFTSRLFLGTGKFSSNEIMRKAIAASGTEMVTVAMKRIDTQNSQTDDMLAHIKAPGIQLLPNTSGVRTAEAVEQYLSAGCDRIGTSSAVKELAE